MMTLAVLPLFQFYETFLMTSFPDYLMLFDTVTDIGHMFAR